MNIAEILQRRAQLREPAIIDTIHGCERVTSFSELQQQVMQATALLRQAGLRAGEKVLVFAPMSLELYVALIALFRLGLVAMFIDPSAGPGHIAQCCALFSPAAFLGGPRAHILRLCSPTLRRIPRSFVIGARLPGAITWSRAASMQPDAEIFAADEQTPALLTFTSGSTGQPKAVLRTHGFLLAQHQALQQLLGGQVGEIHLSTMPIFVLANLASGVTSLIAAGNLRRPGSISAAPVYAQIARYHPTRAQASPAFWEQLIPYCRQQGVRLTSLRVLYAGGAPVFPHVLAGLQEIAPAGEIVAVYGSTEVEPIAHVASSALSAADLASISQGRGLPAGIPAPELAVRILREQWGRAVGPYRMQTFAADCQPAGVPGEIVVSGAHVLPGYVDGRGDEESKFRVDGAIWHRTGDLGYMDTQGRLWLLGRCAAQIKDRLGTLYPFAVECAVSSHPAIKRAAAVQVDGRRILTLELRAHASFPGKEALGRAVAQAGFDAIHIYRHLPVDKRHNAKIDYPALHHLLRSHWRKRLQGLTELAQ
ncbi:MAG TPA: AMP-binding protein [Ktedonobacteraceae bacterium]|jgi:acyl-CoA synthetase (AMP-forming)/AMP-acid ligase II